jgi:DNA-binding NtrC family response regulator
MLNTLDRLMTSLHGKSILVIDDDPAMLRALHKVLNGEGATVASSGWAGDALAQLTEKMDHLDLIITDLRMPLVGGQAILGAAAIALPKVPVIIITAFGNPELKIECLARGAAAFLEKPLDTPQLLGAIREACSRQDAAPASRRSREKAALAKSSGPPEEENLFGRVATETDLDADEPYRTNHEMKKDK